MKNSLIILILFLLTPFHRLSAQHTFEKLITGPEDQRINHVIEDDEGNFLLAGRIRSSANDLHSGYVIKMDSIGNLLDELIIHPADTISYMIFNIHFFNGHYYLLGTSSGTNMNGLKNIWYLKLNKDLELISEKEALLPAGHWYSYFNSIIDSDTNFVIAGYVTRQDDNFSYHNDPGFYKLNLEGDSVNSLFLLEPVKMRYAYDLLEDTNNSGYLAFVSRFTNDSRGQKLILGKDFDSLGIEAVPMGIGDYYSPVYLNDTSILICGLGSPAQSKPYSLNVASLDFQNQLINYNHFEKDLNMREFPAMFNGVSKNSGNIYVAGTSNMDYANPFWSTFDSWFHLVRINTDLSPVWEYWYGGDAYYHLYSIIATDDGGCIMVGNRYDHQTQDQERDIYIVKVNAEGLLVWTQEIPSNGTKEVLYPNPGTDRLIIESKHNKLDFQLINQKGQVVIYQKITNSQSTINTVSLNPGMYFYRLIDNNNNLVESGKWIKN